jgi:hypothetical protein
MNLSEIVNNNCTDKNTRHSYLDVYQNLMGSKKDSAKFILEIGVENGGSIKLWKDFFQNATVYGLDIMNIEDRFANEPSQEIQRTLREINEDSRVKLFTSYNAYDESLFNKTFLNQDKLFDFMIDDGPHTLESMCFFVNYYSKLLADDGVLIIEDIQAHDWLNILTLATPEVLRKYIKIFDLRHIKDRYDDILFVIDKRPEIKHG